MSTTRPEINLHPSSHQVSDLASKIYDVLVIGGGSAGEMTAQRCVRGGLTVSFMFREHLSSFSSFICAPHAVFMIWFCTFFYYCNLLLRRAFLPCQHNRLASSYHPYKPISLYALMP